MFRVGIDLGVPIEGPYKTEHYRVNQDSCLTKANEEIHSPFFVNLLQWFAIDECMDEIFFRGARHKVASDMCRHFLFGHLYFHGPYSTLAALCS
jgi:hypothetical protein